jgi:hypothetical protein
MKVDGRTTTRTWLPESLVEKGGTVEYRMSTVPGATWGHAPADAPPSFRDGEAARQGYVKPGRNVAPAGTATVAEIGVRGASGAVGWTATPPAGLTVEPSSGQVDAGRASPVTVRVAPGTPAGSYRVPVTFTAADGKPLPPNAIQVLVDEPGSLRAAFSNVGVSPDDNQSVASFDPHWNYSTQALAAAGVTPGSTITVDGLAHRWPDVRVGEPDNVVAKGQTITVPSAPGATRLSVLGAGTAGAATGTITITYTDGTTQLADIGLSDFSLGGGVKFGNKVAVTTSYRNSVYGFTAPIPAHVLATAPIALAPGKQVRSVTLPTPTTGPVPTNGVMHIFAITTG